MSDYFVLPKDVELELQEIGFASYSRSKFACSLRFDSQPWGVFLEIRNDPYAQGKLLFKLTAAHKMVKLEVGEFSYPNSNFEDVFLPQICTALQAVQNAMPIYFG